MFEKFKFNKVLKEISPLFSQLPDLSNTINTATDPFLFFDSIRSTLDILTTLSKYEQYPVFSGSLPSADISKIIGGLGLTVSNFLTRYVDSFFTQVKSAHSKDETYYLRMRYCDDLLKAFVSRNAFWLNPESVYSPLRLYLDENYTSLIDIIRTVYGFPSKAEDRSTYNSSIGEIDFMDGAIFEHWCKDFLVDSGFSNVILNGKSGDQGVDILAEKDGVRYAVQCKCYSSDLGNTPIQEVFAGKNFYNCHVAAVLTNRHFTKGGKELAASLGVLLWDRDWIERNMLDSSGVAPCSKQGKYYLDEMTPSAIEIFLDSTQCRISLLQSRLNLGYARAARIVDELEDKGFVGSFRGSRPREIFITRDIWNLIQ